MDPQPAILVDLAFPLAGRSLPREHRAELAAALLQRLPWLGTLPGTGVHRLQLVAGTGPEAPLSARARLLLRVPRDRAGEAAAALAGLDFEVGGAALSLGAPVQRELLPHRTLYAHYVTAPPGDELDFLAMVDAELQALGIRGRPICGRRQSGPDGGSGFSLMLDGLSPDHALRLLQAGIGAHRALGCGLFVPHRSAAAVGA
jgi:CRISPR-associated protein Cas6